MTNKFKNTYIKTGHLSVDELNDLAKKYSKASGYPLESVDGGAGSCYSVFEFLVSVADRAIEQRDTITAVDDLWNLQCHKQELTEITEQDLDDYLNQSKLDLLSEKIKYWDTEFKGSVNGGIREVSMKRTPPKDDKQTKQSNVFLSDSLKTFSIEELNGKSGTISVATDKSDGRDKSIRTVVFHSDDGNVYVISVDEV